MSVMKEVWQGVKILTQFSWLGSKFVVKNTPAALGMLWEVKKEINSALAQGLHDVKIEYKRSQLETKINQLNSPIEPINNGRVISAEEILKKLLNSKEGKGNA